MHETWFKITVTHVDRKWIAAVKVAEQSQLAEQTSANITLPPNQLQQPLW